MSADPKTIMRKIVEDNVIHVAPHRPAKSKPPAAWPELKPLADETASLPDAFPYHGLGLILGNAARAIAADVQAPDSLAGGSVLAAASLAAQPLANVVMPHGQRSPLSLFVITGASSGDRKTATDEVACKPIEDVRKQQARDYSVKLKQFEDDLAARKGGAKHFESQRPAPKSLTTANATVEGIGRLLKCQSSVGVFSAEGGEMLGGHSLRDERRSSGIAFYLKGWGGEALDSLRGGEGLTVLLGRRMTMHVLVQPVLLGGLLGDPLAQGQGLLARSLIAQPLSLAGSRRYRSVNPHENLAVVAYHTRITSMMETLPTLWPEGDGFELKPRDLHLSDAAKELWIEFYNEIEDQQAAGSQLDAARPFASKAAEHAARIAGIITMIEAGDAKQVSDQAMAGAILVAKFYLSEHLRLTGAGQQQRHDNDLRELAEWFQRSGPTVAKKDVLQRSPRRLGRKAERINPMLDELVERGYIRECSDGWEVRRV